MMKRWAWILVFVLLLGFVCWGIRAQQKQGGSPRTETEIIQELVQGYVLVPTVNEKLLAELGRVNRDSADKWREIMECWAESDSAMPVHVGVLPDGLEDSNQLCIIVLGFQLNPDGSMQQELIGRLECARKSAEKYPKSYILCTGGGTAASAATTEADAMAAWLEEKGIAKERILLENQSMTTAENAIYSYELLSQQYPQITRAAIISSDYHIPWASILFQTQFILGGSSITLETNAAYPTSTSLSDFSLRRYQASGILDIAFQ